MKTTDTGGLWRDYVETGSDAAFRELVSRYIDLVYSVAVRRVAGETQLAQEVSQRVFIDLARKARTLPHEVSLGGWLHRHTCFVAGTMVRSEQRRRVREKEAVAMNLLHDNPEADWQQLAPFLDQAIDALADADRQAIVLRFFERRDLRAIGAALGVSEDAAQKRVSRAIEKLREGLTERGVTLSIAALGAMLASHAVISAPASLASSVSNAALAAGGAGIFALLLKLGTPGALKTVVVLGLVTAIAVLVLSRRESMRDQDSRASRKQSSEQNTSPFAAADQTTSNNPIMVAELAAPNPSNVLRLTIVAADSGKPVPSVPIDYRGWENQKFTKKQVQGFRDGICTVEFPRETTTELELTTRLDGFADTRLLWRPNSGEAIPADYTLRLARPVPISGRVIDADGQPVFDAKVGFNHEEDPAAKTFPQSHEFSWIEVSTDADGRWSINRIAPEMIRRLYGSARHSEHVGSAMVHISQNLETERRLRDGTHVFQLGRALTIRGLVVDAMDQPIADAKVFVGRRNDSRRRESASTGDGTFSVMGCKPGMSLLSAEADGFAPTTIEVDAAADSAPFRIVLQPGRHLRLRVVDKNGAPTKASLILDTFHRDRRTSSTSVVNQVQFSERTESGEVVWKNAPAGDLYFSVFAKDCMELRDAKVSAEETEHTFTLSPALVVHGSVRDAETGEKIPRFRIVGGWPQNRTGEGAPSPHWSSIERHWLNFSGGAFRHTFSEALISGMPNPGYVLKFEAEGYASAVSRLIRPDEVDAQVDALLRKESSTLITVLLPNGRPAADADVGLPTHGAGLELAPARFARRSSQGGALLRTDARGQFKLSPDPTIQRVFLVHEDGYAETTPSALTKEPVVSLAAWGRLEGKFYRQGKPVVDAELMPGFLVDGRDSTTVRFSFQEYKIRTDAGGSYVFQKFPPGQFSLIHLIPSPQPGGGMAWSHSRLGTVEIRPGETTTNDIGVAVCGVTLQVHLPDELARNPKLRMFITLHPPGPEAPDEIFADDKAFRAWSMAPGRAALINPMPHHMLSKGADGVWTGGDIAPGAYTLKSRATEYDEAKQESKLLGAARRMGITISAEAVGTTVDLGELKIEPAVPK